MKRILCILLCLVTCFACSLTAFAGGPRTANDTDIANDQAALAAAASLPSGLSFGVTYKIRSMATSGSNERVLNINEGVDNNGTPISMRSPDTDINDKKQKFWLISSESYCKLGAVCSTSGKVLDAYKPITDGCSVDIWS